MSIALRMAKRIGQTTRKLIKTASLILLFYLLQTCIMPHLKIFGVMGNLNMVIIAILTVSFGKKYAFASGAVIGSILESMARNINSFYVIMYPTLALIYAQVFADMSDMKREFRRIKLKSEEHIDHIQSTVRKLRMFRITFMRTSPDDMNPHLRILLNAVCLHGTYEVIMILYAALGGVTLSLRHFSNMLMAVTYTALCCVVMFPVRKFLGMYPKRAVHEVGEDFVRENDEMPLQDWKALCLIPDDPTADSLHGFEVRRDGPPEKIRIVRETPDKPADKVANKPGKFRRSARKFVSKKLSRKGGNTHEN